MDIVREHEVIVFTVLAGKHDVLAVNFTREKSHALVLHCFTVEGYYIKFKKFPGGNQLGQNGQIIISRIGGVVGNLPIVIDKSHEAGVFYALAFVFGNGKDNPFGNSMIGMEVYFIIGINQPVHNLEDFILAR